MNDGPKMTLLGKVVVALFILGCFGGTYFFFFASKHEDNPPGPGGTNAPRQATGGPAVRQQYSGPAVELGIAFGTEKQTWLEWAVREFAGTNEGQKIKINLIPKGSLEGAQAISRDQDKRIHVWSPASALYKDVFVQDWQLKNGNNPILKEEPLALSPMVFVFWEERYNAFVNKYKEVSFTTIGQALSEKSGWEGIAQKPDWGLFKFGHTHPNQSNSGLMTLVLMAYTHHNKSRDLTLKDILDEKYQEWMQGVQRGVSGLSNSTGNMMKDMVLRGPSTYDAIFVYESVAIDRLRNAEGRWGALRVVYPKFNMWNDNPYYILDVPWSTPDHRKAAETFFGFLMSEAVQKQALNHGFRPGNPNVATRDVPDSPFVLYDKAGLKAELGTMCEPPRAEVINNLLAGWERNQGRR